MAKTRATYTIGPPKRPKITHDNGFLDKFAPTTATFGDKVAYMWWGLKTEAAESVQGVPLLPHNDLSDALAADGLNQTRKSSSTTSFDFTGTVIAANSNNPAAQTAA